MEPVVFKLPDLGEGVVEAEIVAWHVKLGDGVSADQPLVDVMTDKATVTIPSGVQGRVLATHGNVGQTIAVGDNLVSFDMSIGAVEVAVGEPVSNGTQRIIVEQPSSLPPATVPLVQQVCSPSASTKHVEPPMASPAVRRRARELHVDLGHLQGSGPNGRITHADIDVFLRSEVSPVGAPRRTPGLHTTEIQMAGLRRRIAEKMVVSKSEIPHFTYIEEVDITELEALRELLNGNRTDGQPKLTYLPFIILSVARAESLSAA